MKLLHSAAVLATALALPLLTGLGTSAGAQEYPDRPITVIVPNRAGGALDIFTRIVAEHLGDEVPVDVVVQNVPGAGTAVGSRMVFDEAADGYTILVHQQALYGITAQGLLDRDLQAIEPIGRAGGTPIGIQTYPEAPFDDLESLQAYAKEHPGEVRAGVTLTAHSHYHALRLMDNLDIEVKLINVPGGDAPQRAALLGRQIELMFMPPATSRSYIESGDFKALAVMSEDRSTYLPDVPTSVEQGFENFLINATYIWFVRADTPDDIKTYLSDKLEATMASDGLIEDLGKQTDDLKFMRGEDLRAAVDAEYGYFDDLTQRFGLEKGAK